MSLHTPNSKAKHYLFLNLLFYGKLYLGLVVKFTIMTSLGLNSLNCKMVKIKPSLFTSQVVIKKTNKEDGCEMTLKSKSIDIQGVTVSWLLPTSMPLILGLKGFVDISF